MITITTTIIGIFMSLMEAHVAIKIHKRVKVELIEKNKKELLNSRNAFIIIAILTLTVSIINLIL
jgi:hypothetical protein